MSFNVDSFSDAKLDELLTRVTKIPEWERQIVKYKLNI